MSVARNQSDGPPGAFDHTVTDAMAQIFGDEGIDGLDSHVRWLFEQMLSHLRSDDFTTREILSTVALWAPVHSRVLRSLDVRERPSATILQLLRD